MSGRILDIGVNFPNSDEHLFFEVRPREFVLSVSWKSAAMYMAFFENRKANVVTMSERKIREQFPGTEDVTDKY